jgi:uncharacterized protein Yka (UPF0111/DUF47 family)
MNTVLKFLKKFQWWPWIIAIVLAILFWQHVSGWSVSRKLFNMALDQFRADQTRIVEQKDEWIKTCEDEIGRLEAEQERLKKEKAAVQQRANQSAAEVARLEGENDALHKRLREIIIPDDPDRIVDNLRKRFPSIRKF